MHEFHHLVYIPSNHLCIIFRIRVFVIQSIAEVASLLEYNHYEMTSILFKVIDHGGNVLMVEARHDEDLFEDSGVEGGFDGCI